MKNKLKYAVSAATAVALTLPAIVLASASGTFNPQVGVATGLAQGSLFNIITNIMRWLLGLVGVVGVIGFAIAGILYLTAAGDETRIETAKKAMTYSIIGVVVAIVGVVIMTAAQTLLGGSSNTF